MSPDQLAMDLATRDVVLAKHQQRDLVRWLEWECYQAEFHPVSVNAARAILRARGINWKECRFLGGVFPKSRWEAVGSVYSDSGRCHGRKVQLFRPRAGAVFTKVQRPDWLLHHGGPHGQG